MVAQPVESFLAEPFIHAALAALAEDGFISDEHEFAPYLETVSVHCEKIHRALRQHGYRGGMLQPGFIRHDLAGCSYYIFDSHRFANPSEAAHAVQTWLDRKYGDA